MNLYLRFLWMKLGFQPKSLFVTNLTCHALGGGSHRRFSSIQTELYRRRYRPLIRYITPLTGIKFDVFLRLR